MGRAGLQVSVSEATAKWAVVAVVQGCRVGGRGSLLVGSLVGRIGQMRGAAAESRKSPKAFRCLPRHMPRLTFEAPPGAGRPGRDWKVSRGICRG